MTVTQAITELLRQDNSVAIPFFGILKSTPIPAEVNVVTNHFMPPCSKITFSPNNDALDDRLTLFLAKENGTTNDEAEQMVSDFVDYCKLELDKNSNVTFEGLGRLVRKYNGSHEFELNDKINLNNNSFGLPEFCQNPILRNEIKPTTDIDNDIDNDNDDDKADKVDEVQQTTQVEQEKIEEEKDKEDKDKDKEESISTFVEKTETEQDNNDDKGNAEPNKPEEKKRRKWPWILLMLLLLLCAGFVALTYFELIPNYIPDIIKPKKQLPTVVRGEPRVHYHYEYTEPEDTTTYLLPYPEAMTRYNDSIQRINDSIQHIANSIAMAESIAIDTTQTEVATPTDTAQSTDNSTVEKPETKNEPVLQEPNVPEPVVEPAKPEPKHFIVCGCFSVEENAQKKATQLHESGFPNAFYKKRGSMWNVYYDGYVDKQEAKAALDEIRSTVNPKAWLLETKK